MYSVVTVGVTVTLLFAQGTGPMLMLMSQLVAFATPLQNSDDDWPRWMIMGFAPKRSITGSGAPTLKAKPALVPPAVETMTMRGPSVAFLSIASLTITEVAFPATIGSLVSSPCAMMRSGDVATLVLITVTPVPLMDTVVPPGTKPVPLKVTSTVLPGVAEAGLALVIAGVVGLIVSVCADVVPPGVVTVIDRAPMSAAAATVRRAVIDVALTNVTSLTETPEPVTATVAPLTKAVPVRVIVVAAPDRAVAGDTPDSVGAVATGGVVAVGVGAVGDFSSQPIRTAAQSTSVATESVGRGMTRAIVGTRHSHHKSHIDVTLP
jgi:hypothetical protein